MKKLKYILFLFICLLSLNISVKADTTWGNGVNASGEGGWPGNTGSGDPTGKAYFWMDKGLGYRISVVSYDKKNKTVRTLKSKTYVSDNYNPYTGTTTDVRYSTSGTKTDYLYNNKSLNWAIGTVPYGSDDGFKWEDISTHSWGEVINYYSKLVNYKQNSSDVNTLKNYLKKEFDIDISEGDRCDEIENYYIIIEPMATMRRGANGRTIYFGTVTELYLQDVADSSYQVFSDRRNHLKKSIYTTNHNFKLGDYNSSFDIMNTCNINHELNENYGCGMGLLWIGYLKDDCKKCYEPKLNEKSSGKLICGKVDENNSAFYEEEYKEVDCDKLSSEQQKDTKYGKWMGTSGSCSMYCTKTLQASFPGKVSGNVMLGSGVRGGSYFAWPTEVGTGLYDMSVTASYKCKAVSQNGSCSNSDIDNLKNKVKSQIKSKNFSIQLTAGNNKKLDHVKLDTKVVKQENLINNDTITISEKVYFNIPNNKNRYYNVVTEDVSDSPFASNNFDRKIGVVSLKKNTEIKDSNGKFIDYSLILNANNLGNFSTIGGKSVTDSKDGLLGNYECDYRLTTGPCTCPNDSDKAGESVECEYEYNKNNNANYTCADAINDYCYLNSSSDNSSTTPPEVTVCDIPKVCYDTDGNKVDITTCVSEKMKNGESEEEADKNCRITLCKSCKNPITGTVIREPFSTCLKEGSSYKSCYSKYCLGSNCVGDECFYYCSGNNCKWKDSTNDHGTISKLICVEEGKEKVCNFKFYCPGGNTKDMDPTSCVIAKSGYGNLTAAYNQGKITEQQLNQYLAECEKVVCPIGNKVIYREIDLNNPFPGKNNQGTLTDFSNNGRGRRPGSNWNSKKVVETKILNARGSKGYSLYNEKPMYVITLTPATIKSIREYNKNKSYSDFTLKCNDDNHSNCISNFLHKDLYDVLSDNGKCKNIKNETDFKECYKNT